jgi:3' exoribonuclease, RNase T-like
MRYFLDTEFIEDGSTIDLISIGIVAEDGREFYGINWDCDFAAASQWVVDNVLVNLPFRPPVNPKGDWYRKEDLTKAVAVFTGCQVGKNKNGTPWFYIFENEEKPEFWADYAAYDHVALCQLFGAMMDLPKGYPMYIHDIQQERDRLGNPELPEQPGDAHHALADARWVKRLYEYLMKCEYLMEINDAT